MNKRLYIVVEGQSEEEFVKDMLAPLFIQHCVYTYPMIIHTSKGHKGGFVNYQQLRNDINRLLLSQGQDVIVTTFVDFFRCPDLPYKDDWCNIQSHLNQVELMEKAMEKDISDRRFIPYIQLHEFEALLFSNADGFIKYYNQEISDRIQGIIDSYDNPEDINSSPEGAPSKRLLGIIQDYDKVMFGNTIALEIGIDTILNKCPRFKAWIELLIERCCQ